jgi:hypothetical protein
MQSENGVETVERKKKKQINNRKKGKMKGKKKKKVKNTIKSLFLSRLHIYIFFSENRQSTKCDLNGPESMAIIRYVKFYFQFNWHVLK